jgi:hypothetical protein
MLTQAYRVIKFVSFSRLLAVIIFRAPIFVGCMEFIDHHLWAVFLLSSLILFMSSVVCLRLFDCNYFASNFERGFVPLHSWRHARSSVTQEISWRPWPQRPGLNPSPVHGRFLVYKGQVFLEYFGFTCHYHSAGDPCSFICLSPTFRHLSNRQCRYVTHLYNAGVWGSGGSSPLIPNLCCTWWDWPTLRPGRFTPWEIPRVTI